MEARIGAIESTLMVQSGALASAAEQAEAHRTELTRMMQDLHETIVHTAAISAKVEVQERPPVRVPPGFQGAELRVTPTKKPEGEDPWSAVEGRSSSDPWANRTARERGARPQQPAQADAAEAETASAGTEDLLLKTLRELVNSAGRSQGSQDRREPKTILEEVKYKRMDTFAGSKEGWGDWSFVFKATTRSVSLAAFQLLTFTERANGPISEDALNSTFMDVNVEKVSGELYDILVTLCKGEALAIVRSETEMGGFAAWQKLHLEYSPRTMARAMQSMAEAIQPPKVSQLKEFETSIRAWEEKLRVLERDFDERISAKMKMAILANMLPANLQDWIYQQGESMADYGSMLDKLRALVQNRLSLTSQKHVGGVEEHHWCNEEEEWHEDDINAVGASVQCHKCEGWGHYSRECPSKGKGKGAAKGGGKGLSKGQSPKG